MPPLRGFFRYRTTFKNYIEVVLKLFFKKFPIKIIFKNGFETIALNAGFVHVASTGINFSYDRYNDLMVFNFYGKFLNFYGTYYNNDIADTFGFQSYSFLNVVERNVIDIGANIGDSSIYFSMKGAKKVLAVEPSPFVFKYLVKNIKINKMEDKIETLNVALGNKINTIKIQDNEVDVTGLKAENIEDGKEISVYTLEKLISEIDNPMVDLVLKMDCEGCEFDSFLNSDTSTLSFFKEIILEYHDYPYSLISKLMDCGFSVKLDGVRISEVLKLSWKNKKNRIGYIYASSIS